LLLEQKFHFVFLCDVTLAGGELRKELESQQWVKCEGKFTRKLTKLDSSGDAKLNNNTLTFTVKTPTRKQKKKRKMK
jgi:hypothetical protein